MVMQKIVGVIVATLFIGLAGAAVPVVSPENHTLEDLVDEPVLVTVVLAQGARHPNVQVVDIGPNYVAVVDEDGKRSPYLFNSIQEIRVQDDPVEARRFVLDEARALTEEERVIVNRAVSRAREVFEAAAGNQPLRMQAAGVLASRTDVAARRYLIQLVQSNDRDIALSAAQWLYVAGEEPESIRDAVNRGLDSGNRQIRAEAAKVAGLYGYTEYEERLLQMAQDRLAEIAAPAAKALAHMGSADAIPILLDMIGASSGEKGEAAVYALSLLGDEEVREILRGRLERTSGGTQFRIARVLHKLGDPAGTNVLRQEIQETPTIAQKAAIVLARTGDFEGRRHLNDRLRQRYDPYPQAVIRRARMVTALIEGQDRGALSALQRLLQSDHAAVNRAILSLAAETGVRSVMPLVAPKINSGDDQVALAASMTAVAIGDPRVRQRLMEVRA